MTLVSFNLGEIDRFVHKPDLQLSNNFLLDTDDAFSSGCQSVWHCLGDSTTAFFRTTLIRTIDCTIPIGYLLGRSPEIPERILIFCCFFLSFFSSFAPILKLISGCDTPEIHYWATWALANLCNVDRKLKALCHSTDCVNNCALNFCVTIFLLSKYSLVKVN